MFTDQDGTTHWEAHGAEAEHGFNFMAQLHGSDVENAVWVVPGSHRWGHLDIPQLVAAHGERLPGAVPMVCAAGDVAIANRNALHCSYPNRSDRTRITLNFGFHKRAAVDAARGADGAPRYEPAEVDRKSRAIALAAAARATHFPAERRFVYKPAAADPPAWAGWDETAREVFAGCKIGL